MNYLNRLSQNWNQKHLWTPAVLLGTKTLGGVAPVTTLNSESLLTM